MPRQGEGIKHKAGGNSGWPEQNRNQVLFARPDHSDVKDLKAKQNLLLCGIKRSGLRAGVNAAVRGK